MCFDGSVRTAIKTGNPRSCNGAVSDQVGTNTTEAEAEAAEAEAEAEIAEEAGEDAELELAAGEEDAGEDGAEEGDAELAAEGEGEEGDAGTAAAAEAEQEDADLELAAETDDVGAGDDGGAELAAEGDTDDIGDDGGLELAAEGDEGADTGDAGLELAAGDEGADEGDAGLELAAADEGADDAGDAGLELASADEGGESDVSGLELAGDTDGGGSEDSGLEVAGDLGGGDDVSGGIELAGEGLEIASASGNDDDFLGIDPEQAALAEIAAQAAAEAGEDPNQAFEDVLSGAASLDDILETAAGGEDTGAITPAETTTFQGFEGSVFGVTGDTGTGSTLTADTVVEADTSGGTDTTTTTTVEEVVTVVETTVDTLEVSATDATGAEDQAVVLNIDASVSDATEQVQDIVISGVPAGAELSAGTDNGNGTWTLNQGDLVNLSITPAANSDQDFQLTVSVTAVETESGATATKTSALNVSVSGVADAPDLNVGQVTGLEDTSTPLNIGVNFVDTDGSETLEVTVIGVPTGATLSAGTDNGDGTWTLSEGDLAGLAITPPADFSGNFDLQVIAQTSEDGTVSNTVGEFNVNVVGTADAPVVTVTDAQGLEDNAIGLSIDVQLSDTDGSESITDITISGVPTGANLSAGTDNGDGTWTLTTADLTGLTVTPPLNSNDDIQLTVTAESSEIGDGSATAFSSFSVFITGVGDARRPSTSNRRLVTKTRSSRSIFKPAWSIPMVRKPLSVQRSRECPTALRFLPERTSVAVPGC